VRFTYNPSSKKLEIYEANGGSFKIEVPYRDFRASLVAFYKQTLLDFQMLYPELTRNKEYLAILRQILSPKGGIKGSIRHERRDSSCVDCAYDRQRREGQ
jgi:hypothetical protein